jgi:hypothetical protein
MTCSYETVLPVEERVALYRLGEIEPASLRNVSDTVGIAPMEMSSWAALPECGCPGDVGHAVIQRASLSLERAARAKAIP